MSGINIQLKPSSILNVPLQTYIEEFSFLVNGKEFKTNRLISDLLSPKICQIHSNDPVFNEFVINTTKDGDFNNILNLAKFDQIAIPLNEVEFIGEVIEILGNESFNSFISNEITKITIDNVISLLKLHEKLGKIYSDQINTEIEFISIHFSDILQTQRKDLLDLSTNLLYRIVFNSKLQLKNEDQLFEFITDLYNINPSNSKLYESVIFINLTTKSMKKFVEIFDFNDLTATIWMLLSNRLEKEIKSKTIKNDSIHRYIENDYEYENDQKVTNLPYVQGKELNGIINYLKKFKGQNKIIENGIIKLTTNKANQFSGSPENLIDYQNSDNCYSSGGNTKDAWVCFDFVDFEVEILSYSIKSANLPSHLKNWVIEISDDSENWTIIDEHRNFCGLNNNSAIHTFIIENKKFTRYCRIRQNGECWYSGNNFRIGKIEFYGKIKEKLH